MNILFIAAGPIEWASSRLRAYWVAEEMGADVVRLAEIDRELVPAHDYGAVIWQKGVNLELLDYWQDMAYHYWDVCDPIWWFQPEDARNIAKRVTAVVASNPALADDFNEWYGESKAITIPDRLKLAHFEKRRQHNTAVSPVRFIWFGLHLNRIALYSAFAGLDRLAANGHIFSLTIMDDRPEIPLSIGGNKYPVYYTRWELSKEVEILASHDIALLPPYPGAWGKVKSDNKMQTAYACGLPVADGQNYKWLEELMNHEVRQTNVKSTERWLDEHIGNVKDSAVDWKKLLTPLPERWLA